MSSFPFQNAALPYRTPLPKDTPFTIDAVEKEPVMDDEDEKPDEERPLEPLQASRDARQIIRLMQCPQCSYPLKEPVTLPCGNSICKKCIPERHIRQNISYPGTPDRLQGFICPLESCGLDHALGDSEMDVVLNKILIQVENVIDKYRTSPEAMEVFLGLTAVTKEVKPKTDKQVEGKNNGQLEREAEKKLSRLLPGGRLIGTYTIAEVGELAYNMDVIYTSSSGISKTNTASQMDMVVMEHLKEAAASELECKVCYTPFLDPFTTPCGHTFCRECLNQVLSHSSSGANYCPLCRRSQAIPPGLRPRDAPSNILLSKLQWGLCPAALASRLELGELELTQEGPDVPLFVCTLSFPTMPTFLHIFEPRYRLMIRRALEDGSRQFGMLLHNPTKEPQGDLGKVHFYEYGTMLEIRNVQMLLDGRSVIETYGISRFKVLSHGNLDGYTIGKIERIGDLSAAGEEAFEAQERSNQSQTQLPSTPGQSIAQDQLGADVAFEFNDRVGLLDFHHMSTMALFSYCVAFVRQKGEQSETWLHRRVFQVYDECPDDPAKFPWWFASVLPTSEEQKYRLLATTTVRERLKISAEWVQSIKAQRCSSESSCTVL